MQSTPENQHVSQKSQLHDSITVPHTYDQASLNPRPSRSSHNSPSQNPPPEHNDLLHGFPSLHHAPTAPISGSRLDRLLEVLHSAIKMEIGAAKESRARKVVMRKCKIFFYIGVNNVTRALERMPLVRNKLSQKELPDFQATMSETARAELGINGQYRRDVKYDKSRNFFHKTSHIQAVLAASDVHPRLLVSHLPDLAASRNVPLLTISGGSGTGSMRLGAIFNVRTAIAVGLKNGDSAINAVMKSLLDGKY